MAVVKTWYIVQLIYPKIILHLPQVSLMFALLSLRLFYVFGIVGGLMIVAKGLQAGNVFG